VLSLDAENSSCWSALNDSALTVPARAATHTQQLCACSGMQLPSIRVAEGSAAGSSHQEPARCKMQLGLSATELEQMTAASTACATLKSCRTNTTMCQAAPECPTRHMVCWLDRSSSSSCRQPQPTSHV
jgi:hypothetical protein